MSIGDYNRKISESNKEAIRSFFKNNPFCTQLECAKALGMNVMTVSKHIKSLRQEIASQHREKDN